MSYCRLKDVVGGTVTLIKQVRLLELFVALCSISSLGGFL